MRSEKYRIIKITYGDTHEEFIVQRRNWIGKWVNAFPECDEFPAMIFSSLEAAEKAYSNLIVDPIVEVIKEY